MFTRFPIIELFLTTTGFNSLFRPAETTGFATSLLIDFSKRSTLRLVFGAGVTDGRDINFFALKLSELWFLFPESWKDTVDEFVLELHVRSGDWAGVKKSVIESNDESGVFEANE